ncbi:MAG: hypothetical protein OXG72_11315 [Acidobacteria bacterium]|nr:hypothetical protein [Acidobacteriota bacterium]
MDIQTILEYLNAVPVRATYGAVGDVLGVRPQAVSRLLGAQRPEASWIVNGSTGEPTGYAPEKVDSRLPGTHIIRTGDELRRCLESEPTPAPAPVPAVNDMAGRAVMPETEVLALNSDARWIIGTLVPVFLLVAGLLAAQIASVSRGLNTRIDEVNGRIDDLTEQIAGVDARIDDVRTELQSEIAVLRSDVASIAEQPSAVEPAPGGTEPNAVPVPTAGEPETSPDAPETSPDAPETSPAAPETNPDAPAEPPADPDAPVVAPAPPPE